MFRTIAIATGFVGVLAVSGAFLVAHAAPEPGKPAQSFPSGSKAAKTFDATCSANEQVDSRPDPKWVGESFAGDNCVAPSLPKRLDGYGASLTQVKTGIALQKKYAVAADAYQRCISRFVASRKVESGSGKKFMDVAMVTIENHRVAASETAKRLSAAQLQVSVRQYNEAGSEDCK